MKKRACFFQALNREYGRTLGGDLFKVLPDSFSMEVREAPLVEAPLKNFLQNPFERLSYIHYSWLLEPLKNFSPFERDFAVSILDDVLKKGLKKSVTFEENPPPPFIRDILFKKWISFVFPKEQLPIQCLPKTEFSFLLELPKNQLVSLINYLGLCELADLLKRVVDKKQIMTFFSFLTKDEQYFLKQSMQKKELFRLNDKTFQTLLKKGMAGEKSLRDYLHTQGLIRLGIILSKTGEEFLWHFGHKLDTGRAKILLKYSSKTVPDPIKEALTMQFFSVLNKLNIEVDHGN